MPGRIRRRLIGNVNIFFVSDKPGNHGRERRKETGGRLKLLDWIPFPDGERIAKTKPGAPLAVTGATQSLTAALAAKGAEEGRRVLLVAENDLKAGRMAEDVRHLTGRDCAFLPGGEIDLTRAAGSQESSWRRLEALSSLGGSAQVLVTSAEAMMQRMGRPEPFRQACFTLQPGDRMPLSELSLRLTRMGYERVTDIGGLKNYSGKLVKGK